MPPFSYSCIVLQFTDDADSVSGNGSLESLTAKDLTKYVYGVAKGMEYIVSKGVSKQLFSECCERGWFFKDSSFVSLHVSAQMRGKRGAIYSFIWLKRGVKQTKNV